MLSRCSPCNTSKKFGLRQNSHILFLNTNFSCMFNFQNNFKLQKDRMREWFTIFQKDLWVVEIHGTDLLCKRCKTARVRANKKCLAWLKIRHWTFQHTWRTLKGKESYSYSITFSSVNPVLDTLFIPCFPILSFTLV